MSEILLRILLDSSVRMLLVSVAAGFLLRVFRHDSSEVRHWIWTIVVCAMLSMPMLTSVLPALAVTLRIPSKLSVQRMPHLDNPTTQQPLVAPAATYGTASETGKLSIATPVRSQFPWAGLMACIYAVGLLYFLTRLCVGFFGMRRIVRRSSHAVLTVDRPVYESDELSTPFTLGIFSPRIILPRTWRAWQKDDLQAILAHETEHLRRRDPLTALFAHINCCVFWFHPLAWWLEKKLAACAEEACDNAAIQCIDSPQRYAEILLDMARAVQLQGARLSWTIGMKGNGKLAERIDRILKPRIGRAPSFTRTLAASLACISTVLLIAACRERSLPTLADEQQALARVESQERIRMARVDADRARQLRLTSAFTNADRLPASRAADLEAKLVNDPEAFSVRLELLAFYLTRAQKAGVDVPSILHHRRQHILWFIQSHPMDELASSPLIFINTDTADLLADPEGYALGKAAWLAKVQEHPSNAAVLGNAGYFLQNTDKTLAESYFLQAQQLQPDGRWMDRLARLYTEMILGTAAIYPPLNELSDFSVLSTNTADQHGPLAQKARRKLDATDEFGLLFNTGRILVNSRNINVDFDAATLGVRYLKRAAAIVASADQAAQVRVQLNRLITASRQARIQQLPKEGRYEAVMALSERDRFELLWDLALFHYGYGNSFDANHRGNAIEEWHKAANYAEALASVAEEFRTDPEYGNAIFNSNMMLAYVESRSGNKSGTLRYLRKALKAPTASKAGEWPSLWCRVCPFLVQEGHKADVIDFLEQFAQIDPTKRDNALAAAAQLRNGTNPNWSIL